MVMINEFQKPFSKAVTDERWQEIFGEVDETLDDGAAAPRKRRAVPRIAGNSVKDKNDNPA